MATPFEVRNIQAQQPANPYEEGYFSKAAEGIIENINKYKAGEALKLAKLEQETKTQQAVKNRLRTSVGSPTEVGMWGRDYNVAQEAAKFLQREDVIAQYAEDEVTQAQYQQAVNNLDAYMKAAENYYSTTYGDPLEAKDPKGIQKGTWLSATEREARGGGIYEATGFTDRNTYDMYSNNYNTLEAHDVVPGTMRLENGTFTYDRVSGGTGTLDMSAFQATDVFAPQLERTEYKDPAEFYRSNQAAHVRKAKTEDDARTFATNWVLNHEENQMDALRYYNNRNDGNYSRQEFMSNEELRNDIINSYVDEAIDLWEKPEVKSKGSTKKKPSIPRAVSLGDDEGSFMDVTNETGSNRLATTKLNNVDMKVIGLKLIGKNIVVQFVGGSDATIPLEPENPMDELTDDQRMDRVRLEEYLNKVFGEGGYEKVIAELSGLDVTSGGGMDPF
jgi:hypothetical protein